MNSKKAILLLFLFLLVAQFSLSSFFLDFESIISLLPFSHYYSIDGLEYNNSYKMFFNDIDLTNPLNGKSFFSPSRTLYKNIDKQNNPFINLKLVDEDYTNHFGLFTDGFSLKEENSKKTENSLLFDYANNNIKTALIVSNYGISYEHYKNKFSGPQAEFSLSFSKGILNLSLYSKISNSDDSSFLFDELESGKKIEFFKQAKANLNKKFLGASLLLNKIYSKSSLRLLTSFSYGDYDKKGNSSSESMFNLLENKWTNNYPKAKKMKFSNFKAKISYGYKTKYFTIKPFLKFKTVNSNQSISYPQNGVVFGNLLKIKNYGYELNTREMNFSSGLSLKYSKKTKSPFVSLLLNYNNYTYGGDNWEDKITLNSIDINTKAGYKNSNILFYLQYSKYSKPLNHMKLSYLSNSFYNSFAEIFLDNRWQFLYQIDSPAYEYDGSKNFNSIDRLEFYVEKNFGNITISTKTLLSNIKNFWDRWSTNPKNDTGSQIYHIGAISKDNESILFNPERKFFGFNLSLNANLSNFDLLTGISYLKTKGNYNNHFFSILNSFGSNSDLFLNTGIQSYFTEDFNSAFGNGVKYYLISNYILNKSISIKGYFLHLPPVNYITFSPIISPHLSVKNIENKGESLNLLSASLFLNKGNFEVFFGISNILNSTPGIYYSALDETPLINYPGKTILAGILYNY